MKITYNDYTFLQDLCQRNYTNNSMLSMASKKEHDRYIGIQTTLKKLTYEFWKEFFNSDTAIKRSGSTGNPLHRSGKLKWPWSCVYKGNNKQYGAQISIIFEPSQDCMKVGFFFGGASRHNLSMKEKIKEMKNMKLMAHNLNETIVKNSELLEQFISLESLGFVFSADGKENLDPLQWLNCIERNPIYAQITASIPLVNTCVITIDSFKDYYSQIVFLLKSINSNVASGQKNKRYHIDSDTRKRRMDILERIGKVGEEFIMQEEKKKLKNLSLSKSGYPIQVSLYDDSCGYDILSLDENGKNIYIEVKSTVLLEGQTNTNRFFMSDNEWQTYQLKKGQYILYRVYGVGGELRCEKIDLSKVNKKPLNYIVDY